MSGAVPTTTAVFIQLDHYDVSLKLKGPTEDRVYLGKYTADLTNADVEARFKRACNLLSQRLASESAGSTASIGFVYGGMLYLAQIGDSAINLIRSSAVGGFTIEALHPWHTGSVKAEYGKLNVGRALGDSEFCSAGGKDFGSFNFSTHALPATAALFGFSDGLAKHCGDADSPITNATRLAATLLSDPGLTHIDLKVLGQTAADLALTKRIEIEEDFTKRSCTRSHCDDISICLAQPEDGLLMIIADGHQGDEVSKRVVAEFPDLLALSLQSDTDAVFSISLTTETAIATATTAFTTIARTDETDIATRTELVWKVENPDELSQITRIFVAADGVKEETREPFSKLKKSVAASASTTPMATAAGVGVSFTHSVRALLKEILTTDHYPPELDTTDGLSGMQTILFATMTTPPSLKFESALYVLIQLQEHPTELKKLKAMGATQIMEELQTRKRDEALKRAAALDRA